jgi:hypothetical protein
MHFTGLRCNVRKLLSVNILIAVALTFASIGCGGTPTAPTTTPTAQTNALAPAPVPTPSPSPAPPPEPAPAPEPSPAPPAPTPAPPDAAVHYDAHVNSVHWYGSAIFTGEDFEIVRYPDRIVFGSMTLPIVHEDDRTVLAKTQDMTFSAIDSSWTFNGLAGQGSGVWTKRGE